MKERENELKEDLKEGKNIFEWLVFKVHGISSNHSQDWLLVLFWIISLTFLTSFMKTIDCNFHQISEKIVLSSIVISIIFFINLINPFSIMTGKEELSFGILLYKITITYLIYQLIVSIRQNTRRK